MVEFEFKAYRRAFAERFRTASDSMLKREGILLRVRDEEGRVGFGEVASIDSCGTEAFVSAFGFWSEMAGKIEYEAIAKRLSEYPCLQYGLSSALAMMVREEEPLEPPAVPLPVCGLLPEISDTETLAERLDAGYRCLKFKIGKAPFPLERRALEEVFERTGGEVALRLDANGGLDLRESMQWLESVEGLPVEFLEQPLPREKEGTLLALASDHAVPIALDESAVSVDDLKRWKDRHWPGIFVVKPSLSGDCRALAEELETSDSERLVFSSSLETRVGSANALSVALERGVCRALGFGVGSLFVDDGFSFELGSHWSSGLPGREEFESLWKRI